MATRRAGGRPPRWSAADVARGHGQERHRDRDRLAGAAGAAGSPTTCRCRASSQRDCNEFAAKMIQDHPGRFGQFATISPPDVEDSLKEIEYSLDTLKADGVSADDELRRQISGRSVVRAGLSRSSTAARRWSMCIRPRRHCCGELVPGIPASAIEYATDSTRTIAHLVFGGTATKYPGHPLDLLAQRRHAAVPDRAVSSGWRRTASCADPLPEFRKFHYELAQGNTPGQIAALLKMVPISQVLYGTDYPFRRRRRGQRRDRGLRLQRRRHPLDRARSRAQADAAAEGT